MLEDDHSKVCGYFMAQNSPIFKGVLSWGDILLYTHKKIVKFLPQLSWEYKGFRICSP